MSYKIYGCVLAAGLAVSMGNSSGAAEKRRHDAHAHGVAEINIAVDGTEAEVEFRAPAENVMGFEHEAKSESDKKKRDAALRTVQTKMSEMVVFDSKLGCKFSEVKTEVVEEKEHGSETKSGKTGHDHKDEKKTGEHREVHANFSVACAQPLAGSRVTFGVQKNFRSIDQIKVQVVGDAKQSGATIKKDKGEVRL
jgi:Protein of unknown function (DUF2796)